MICQKCKTENSKEAKFCKKCGNTLTANVAGSVDLYFAKQRACQICGSFAETKEVEFNQNIGMLFARRESTIKGRLCKKCIKKEFRGKTLTTLILGWWGTISFFVTPVYLLGNVYNLGKSIGMKDN